VYLFEDRETDFAERNTPVCNQGGGAVIRAQSGKRVPTFSEKLCENNSILIRIVSI
jgi:hypothetical protein